MEKICRDLPESVLSTMTEYEFYSSTLIQFFLLNFDLSCAIWLIDHSHESGRASAAMYFAYGMRFKPILDRFEQLDGLRRLYNYISTLTVLLKDESEIELLTDEHYVQSILTIKNTVLGIRTYIFSFITFKPNIY